MVVLAPWVAVLWLARHPAATPSVSPALVVANPSARSHPVVEQGHPGPWGELEASRILIEPPEDFIPAFFTTSQPLRWTFKGYTPVQLSVLWQQAGLTAAQLKAFDDPQRRVASPEGIVLTPPAETVLGLSPESRAKIYAVLALDPANIPQRDPFRVRADTVADWFDDTALPEDIIALTRRLLYQRDTNFLFADHDLVLPKLPASADRVQFIKTLSRKTALLVQLRVPHGTDIDGLTRYWGQGRRSKDVRPLLQSLAHQPQGGTLDIVHLLPPFARTLLYTYPVPTGKPTDATHDCHWTSLNFYNNQPDERYASLQAVEHALLNDYYLVSGEPALGDILLLVDSSGRGVHSCVYVADNIVFTKNGAAFSVPWLLGRLENVVSFYSLTEPLAVRRYRVREK